MGTDRARRVGAGPSPPAEHLLPGGRSQYPLPTRSKLLLGGHSSLGPCSVLGGYYPGIALPPTHPYTRPSPYTTAAVAIAVDVGSARTVSFRTS